MGRQLGKRGLQVLLTVTLGSRTVSTVGAADKLPDISQESGQRAAAGNGLRGVATMLEGAAISSRRARRRPAV